ncbi:MAG: DNA-binding domain-containing protein [Gammaproteobacteria bacterium]
MNTDGLRMLQQQFQSYILRRDEYVVRWIEGTRRVDNRTRLGIYAEAYRLRLLEALRVDFPALHTLAGDDGFERIGRAYIDACPSEHYSIRYFGRQMSAFLAHDNRFRDTPVFAEMAAFEWALGLSFDAADDVSVAVEAVGAIPCDAWPDLRLCLHPSVQRLDLCWNIPGLWKAIQEEQPPQPPVVADQPQAWVIWRRGLQSYFRSVPVDEARALDALGEGQCFAELCAGLCEWIEEEQVAAHAALLLRRWVSDGLIVHIDLA